MTTPETTPSATTPGEEPFELPRGEAPPADELVVDLDGYEGPIDVLLSLAREQKVDLTKISILQLADQYLAFISAAHQMRLEIAADYLVIPSRNPRMSRAAPTWPPRWPSSCSASRPCSRPGSA